MAINTLAFCTKLSSELDKALVQKSVTSFLADNAMRAKFVGAKTVLLPDIDFQGLGDYNRDTGFVRGSVTVAQTPYNLTMDRARTFSIDREDMDETGVAGLAGQVLGEFVRTKVAPEMDAYVLSTLAKVATDAEQTLTLGTSKTIDNGCVDLLNRAMQSVQATAGFDEELVAFLDSKVYAALLATPELTRQLDVGSFKKGQMSTQAKYLNGMALLPVPDSRMKDSYDFKDGTTTGEEAGGFSPASAAKSIGLLILPKKACSLIKKTEKMRVFEPDQNQQMDAYKFDYRVYYDAFVKKSYKPTVYVYTY